MITADGKYLFFLSARDGDNHAYWVEAQAVTRLRPASEK
ncbi:MAG: hypothetical protein H6P95_2871 [Candidatus Aminicenantes bacterium]|nr:hypothetical protein [Candidatus Aminicenantes bacterium]